MDNEQRLIPFLGGLAIGGLGGAIVDNNRYNYINQYPNYYNPYPYYQYNYYPQPQYYQPYNYNSSSMYPINQNTTKIMGDVPGVISYSKNSRTVIKDSSFVPPYLP